MSISSDNGHTKMEFIHFIGGIFMKTMRQLYDDMLEQRLKEGKVAIKDYDPFHLSCLLKPGDHTPHHHVDECEKCAYDKACQNSCLFDAIEEMDGVLAINPDKCAGCEACVEACEKGAMISSKDVFPVLHAVRNQKKDVYAMVAPAIAGQFEGVTSPGKIRAALKAIGFKGMMEVAAFADILTLKEALEFDHNIKDDHDFHLSSCCCPMWISMVRKECSELFDSMPASVSPMVACGRVVKQLHPGAVTVFIGPCMAKKKEAKEVDISDATDYVLTFQELKEIFTAAGINPAEMPDDEKEHASSAGIIYARAGGVAEAVQTTLEQLNPDREIPFKSETANGALECKKLIGELKAGHIDANFYEGMGCAGGCVGGPKRIIDKEAGTAYVNGYSQEADYKTPLDNPYILEMLGELGYSTVREFIEKSDFLTRDFSVSQANIQTP